MAYKEEIRNGIAAVTPAALVGSDGARIVHIDNSPSDYPDSIAAAGLDAIDTDIQNLQQALHNDLVSVKTAVENMNVNIGNLDVTITDSIADNLEGFITDLVVDGIGILASFTTTGVYKLKGFSATGNADGKYKIKVEGATKLVGRTNIVSVNCLLVLPDPLEVGAGNVITLEVTNIGVGPGDYDGVIIGE